jgi:ATP-dependent Lhr-like helicase
VLVFTNVRSAAEQIGLRLKSTLPELSDQIETPHASLGRSVPRSGRSAKNGELRAVVCSTSLELGIDMALPICRMAATLRVSFARHSTDWAFWSSIELSSHGVLVALM